jgi:hypothetical protein
MNMRGLELLHPPDARAHPELGGLCVQIGKEWPELLAPVVLAWTERPVVAIDDSGVPWIYGPVERDPLRGSAGRTVIPRRELARLKGIAELGIPFQRLAIAHELDSDGPVQQLLPQLQAGPRTCTDELARALVGELPAHPGITRAIRVLDAAVRGATSAVPIDAVITILDPIIFGIIAPTHPRQGQPCLWYPLAAWRW